MHSDDDELFAAALDSFEADSERPAYGGNACKDGVIIQSPRTLLQPLRTANGLVGFAAGNRGPSAGAGVRSPFENGTRLATSNSGAACTAQLKQSESCAQQPGVAELPTGCLAAAPPHLAALRCEQHWQQPSAGNQHASMPMDRPSSSSMGASRAAVAVQQQQKLGQGPMPPWQQLQRPQSHQSPPATGARPLLQQVPSALHRAQPRLQQQEQQQGLLQPCYTAPPACTQKHATHEQQQPLCPQPANEQHGQPGLAPKQAQAADCAPLQQASRGQTEEAKQAEAGVHAQQHAAAAAGQPASTEQPEAVAAGPQHEAADTRGCALAPQQATPEAMQHAAQEPAAVAAPPAQPEAAQPAAEVQPAPSKPRRLKQLFDYLLVLDIEATCDRDKAAQLQPQVCRAVVAPCPCGTRS